MAQDQVSDPSRKQRKQVQVLRGGDLPGLDVWTRLKHVRHEWQPGRHRAEERGMEILGAAPALCRGIRHLNALSNCIFGVVNDYSIEVDPWHELLDNVVTVLVHVLGRDVSEVGEMLAC